MATHFSGNGLHFAIGNKVFETKEEVICLCKDLMKKGIVRCYRETMADVTHRYTGNGKAEKTI